jgi:hypothetical protein
MAKWTIKSVICTRGGAAGQFAVVHLENDLYAITIDGHCLEVFTWHAGQLQECIDFMMHMASRSMGPASQPQSIQRPPAQPMSMPEGPSAAA